MRFDPLIQKGISELPDGYEIIRKKDHYFLQYHGLPRICLGGTTKQDFRLIKMCVVNLRKLGQAVREMRGK